MKKILFIPIVMILMLAGVLMSGCTSNWTKEGMTHSQLRTDVASCKFQVRRMVEEGKIPYKRAIMEEKLNECLISKGYRQKKKDDGVKSGIETGWGNK